MTSGDATQDSAPSANGAGAAASGQRRIAVFCGSRSGIDERFRHVAVEVGQAMARGGHERVYGGGDVGLMGAVAGAVLEAGGAATGVITQQLWDLEVGHRGLTHLEVVEDMHARKARMAELADAVIVLPGGFGTYDEAFEILTWNQLGLVAMPVVFLDLVTGAGNGGGFYAPIFEMIASAVAAGFMKPDHGELALRASSAAEAVEVAAAPAAAFTPKWGG